MSATNFVSSTNATSLVTRIAEKFNALAGAYVIRPACTFANLPSTLTAAMTGYVYNVTNEFTTDNRFVEGIGKKYSAGTNVVVVNNGTAQSADMKFDVISAFVDVDGINTRITNVREMITNNAFNSTSAYAIGDIVSYEDGLYKFKAAHTANTDWDSSEVDEIDVVSLVDDIDSDISAVNTRVTNVREMISGTEFSASTAYEIGDIVTYGDGLYKFKAAHAAGAWDSSDVDEIDVVSLVQSAEPDSLTGDQMAALLALLA